MRTQKVQVVDNEIVSLITDYLGDDAGDIAASIISSLNASIALAVKNANKRFQRLQLLASVRPIDADNLISAIKGIDNAKLSLSEKAIINGILEIADTVKMAINRDAIKRMLAEHPELVEQYLKDQG